MSIEYTLPPETIKLFEKKGYKFLRCYDTYTPSIFDDLEVPVIAIEYEYIQSNGKIDHFFIPPKKLNIVNNIIDYVNKMPINDIGVRYLKLKNII